MIYHRLKRRETCQKESCAQFKLFITSGYYGASTILYNVRIVLGISRFTLVIIVELSPPAGAANETHPPHKVLERMH